MIDRNDKLSTVSHEIVFWISAGCPIIGAFLVFSKNRLFYDSTTFTQNPNNFDWKLCLIIISGVLIFNLFVSYFRHFVRNNKYPWKYYYWFQGFVGLAFTFCLVNCSGGIMSPFIAIYPIFASTVITLFSRGLPRLVMISSILIGMVFHCLTQLYWGMVPEIDSSGIFYRMWYAITIVSLIILTIYIDWKSRQKT